MRCSDAKKQGFDRYEIGRSISLGASSTGGGCRGVDLHSDTEMLIEIEDNARC